MDKEAVLKLDKILMNIRTALMEIGMSHVLLRITKSSIAQAYKWRSVTIRSIRIKLQLRNCEKRNI
mgnify:CR=1 FL=1